MTRIVVRYLSGANVNQVGQFPLDAFGELTIGRDPSSTIAFDAQKDDLVSRRHAVIKCNRGDRLSFTITDLGSANGTFINRIKLLQDSELLPGDVVQLGTGGPSFVFDVEPRPSHLIDRTRVGPSYLIDRTRVGGWATTASAVPI